MKPTNSANPHGAHPRATRAARQSRRALIGLHFVQVNSPDFQGLAQRLRCEANRCRKEAIFYSQLEPERRAA